MRSYCIDEKTSVGALTGQRLRLTRPDGRSHVILSLFDGLTRAEMYIQQDQLPELIKHLMDLERTPGKHFFETDGTADGWGG